MCVCLCVCVCVCVCLAVCLCVVASVRLCLCLRACVLLCGTLSCACRNPCTRSISIGSMNLRKGRARSAACTYAPGRVTPRSYRPRCGSHSDLRVYPAVMVGAPVETRVHSDDLARSTQ